MVYSESELRLIGLFPISWLNKISSKGQIGSTCMGPLASEITFAKKKTYITFKNRSCTFFKLFFYLFIYFLIFLNLFIYLFSHSQNLHNKNTRC